MKASRALYAVAVLLLLGALPLPYSYYIGLRFAASLSCAYVAYVAFQSKHWPTLVAVVALLLLFNPAVPVRLDKASWAVADASAAAYMAAIAKHVESQFANFGPVSLSVSNIIMSLAAAAFAGAFAATALAFILFLISLPMEWLGQANPFRTLRFLFPAAFAGGAVFLLAGLAYHVASSSGGKNAA